MPKALHLKSFEKFNLFLNRADIVCEISPSRGLPAAVWINTWELWTQMNQQKRKHFHDKTA